MAIQDAGTDIGPVSLPTIIRRSLAALVLSAGLSTAHANDHDPMVFDVLGAEIIASGEIDGEALLVFADLVEAYPDTDTLVLRYVGGSVDDAANLEFGRLVHDLGFLTVVPSDGLVASGGADLFLSGVDRVLEPGACVGVHAWATSEYTATDLPPDDPEHDSYLDYYADIGADEGFYWFTLDAAPADKMHWMTRSEADSFGMVSDPAPRLGSAETCDQR